MVAKVNRAWMCRQKAIYSFSNAQLLGSSRSWIRRHSGCWANGGNGGTSSRQKEFSGAGKRGRRIDSLGHHSPPPPDSLPPPPPWPLNPKRQLPPLSLLSPQDSPHHDPAISPHDTPKPEARPSLPASPLALSPALSLVASPAALSPAHFSPPASPLRTIEVRRRSVTS